MSTLPKRVWVAILLTAVLAGCRPELVVRFQTTVYRDGTVSRSLELRASGESDETKDTEDDAEEDWLDASGVSLPDADLWASVERGPGWLKAEGFFLGVDDLPPLLAFDVGDSPRPARMETRLEIAERSILTRWVYSETHGDPYSAAESARALDAVLGLLVEALDAELRRLFGPELDSGPADEFLRGEARALAWAMMAVNRGAPGAEQMETRAVQWTQLLSQYGLAVAPAEESESFWDAQVPVLLDWARGRVAAALSLGEQEVQPAELTFWPSGADWEEQATAILERVWGSEQEFYEQITPYMAAMAGFYGGDDAPRFSFESRVRMPGALVRTNGTPDGESVIWLFRQQDLSDGDFVLRAESVEPIWSALTDLGARRDFDRAALLRLIDLLWRQDSDLGLTRLLDEAVRQKSLGPLRDEEAVAPQLQDLARELADLLDPDVPLPAPL